ncbi:uncharacterized protein LOC117217885 isoform X2 [Megalopta genalis]
MSDLNDSVIICETLSDSNKQKQNLRLNQEKAKKIKRKTFYESPLRHIQLSGKRWEERIKMQEKLNSTVANQQINKSKNRLFSNNELNSLCQDSIIVLSDNECESIDATDKHVCKDKGQTEKRFLKKLDNNNTNRPLKRKKSHVLVCSKKRKSIFLSDNEDSDIAAVEVDDENRVPLDSVNQSTDDVVVVWSSKNVALSGIPTKDGTIVDEGTMEEGLVNFGKDREDSLEREEKHEETGNQKRKEGEAAMVNEEEESNELVVKEITDEENEAEKTINLDEDNRLFMIDFNPDPKNLHCLITKKKKKKTIKNNNEREAHIHDNDLLFNKKGLKLPHCAKNIEVIVTTERRKSFSTILSKLEQKSSELYSEDTQPGTSSTQTVATNDVSLNTVLRGRITFPLTGLREIVIDGNNVAMAHTNGKTFSEIGLMIVINYFRGRGHLVKVFVPQYRRSINCPLLEEWYTEGIVVFTPSRYIAGKWITPYDDRYIIQYATICKGIVISSDQFRDLYKEKPEWRDTIINRLMAPTFVGDIVMFPEDPLGRTGPTLEQFLRH